MRNDKMLSVFALEFDLFNEFECRSQCCGYIFSFNRYVVDVVRTLCQGCALCDKSYMCDKI